LIRLELGSVFNINDYDELARMFLPRGEYELVYAKADNFESVPVKLEKLREIYNTLSDKTGRSLSWGVLTGVKPVKLYTQLLDENKLKVDYLVSEEKIRLLRRVYDRQKTSITDFPEEGLVSVYIGIPFCPTRCSYCTFTSGVGTEKQMGEYLDALFKELDFMPRGIRAESVYIGGGTPTALPYPMFEELLSRVNEKLLHDETELTVEAGRPDTIDMRKAESMAKLDARVSVNPQTMKDETLKLIGRAHTAADSIEAFGIVRAAGVKNINADIIAGLPGENVRDFENTLEKTDAENITLHTLALKKGSALRERDGTEAYYSDASDTAEMLKVADKKLSERGMEPYYLYRQKQTVGNLENTGYSKSGLECVYNMRMMQERQCVVALGAGAVSKLYFRDEDRIERVFNVADTGLYVARLHDMIERKRRLFEAI